VSGGVNWVFDENYEPVRCIWIWFLARDAYGYNAVCATVWCPSVCQFVCLSVTSRHYTQPCSSYFAPGRVPSTVMSMSVYLCVCLLTYLENHAAELHQTFLYMLPVVVFQSLSGGVANVRHVIYFRYCG